MENLYDRLKQEHREKIENDKIKYPSLHESVITSMKSINSWNLLTVDDAIYLTVVIADETFDVRVLNNMFNRKNSSRLASGCIEESMKT